MTTSGEREAVSLRSWLDQLDAAGQLRRITAQVDWDQEIGALARVNLALGGPALLFENIKDYQHSRGRRLLTCSLGNRSQACLLLGLPVDSTDQQIVRHCKEVFRQPLPPVMVGDGPVKRNIVRPPEVDLLEFPVPKWHHLDGGRFLDTFCGVVTRDPRSGRPNVGLYRGQVVGRDKVGKLLIATQHWGGHFGSYRGTTSRRTRPPSSWRARSASTRATPAGSRRPSRCCR
jgi:4-hydroxy-3-polyprenylbenzoate decarboxylase